MMAMQVWSELDPQATHFIPAIQLATLIQELRPPLGVKGEESVRAKIQGIVMCVDIPVRNGKVWYGCDIARVGATDLSVRAQWRAMCVVACA